MYRRPRRPLTTAEWEGIAGRCREALAILRRLGPAIAAGVAKPGRMAGLVARMDRRLDFVAIIDLAGLAAAQLGLDRDAVEATFRPPAGGDRLGPASDPAPAPLSREGWAALGLDCKRLHRLLVDAERMLQPGTNQAERRALNDVYRHHQMLKRLLDAALCRAHRGWDGATRVFYGDPPRPPLDEELEARGNCRAGLVGLMARRVEGGPALEIRATTWDARGRLTVSVGDDPSYHDAAKFVLVDWWPATCCRPREGAIVGRS